MSTMKRRLAWPLGNDVGQLEVCSFYHTELRLHDIWLKQKTGEIESNSTDLFIPTARNRLEDVSGCWVMNISSCCDKSSMILDQGWQIGHGMVNIYKSGYLVMVGA